MLSLIGPVIQEALADGSAVISPGRGWSWSSSHHPLPDETHTPSAPWSPAPRSTSGGGRLPRRGSVAVLGQGTRCDVWFFAGLLKASGLSLEAIRKTFSSVYQQASVCFVVLGKPGASLPDRVRAAESGRTDSSDLATGVSVPFPERMTPPFYLP